MKAIRIDEPGGPDVLRVVDVPIPEPGRHEIRVRVEASGLNRADVLQRKGGYPAPPGAPADIPGLEFTGTVESVGDGVMLWQPGDRVLGIVAGGGYAEYVIAHERTAVRVPDNLSSVDAGAVPEVFMTAYDALFRQAGLEAGETVLIHAVGSGVGTAGVQLAGRAGARTIGTSRTQTKLDAAAGLGLDHAVLGDAHWPDRVREATEHRGVDVILDLVGGAYLAANQSLIATGGRHMVVGVPSGSSAEIDLRSLMGKRASIRGTVLRARPLEEKAALAREFDARVMPGFLDGSLHPIVHGTFAPEAVAEAHDLMERNLNFGKLLLVWE